MTPARSAKAKATDKRAATLLALSLILAGCESAPRGKVIPAAAVASDAPWRGIVKPEDLDRINRVGGAWSTALATARRAGFTRRLRAEGPLLDPEVALPLPAPAPGAYRCRLFRLGAAPRGRGAFSVLGPFYCFVSGDAQGLSLVRETGSPRPGGQLHPDGPTRMVFVGANALLRETSPPAYGERPDRDVVGLFERVDNFRYRLVLPWRPSAPLEVYELVPEVGPG